MICPQRVMRLGLWAAPGHLKQWLPAYQHPQQRPGEEWVQTTPIVHPELAGQRRYHQNRTILNTHRRLSASARVPPGPGSTEVYAPPTTSSHGWTTPSLTANRNT